MNKIFFLVLATCFISCASGNSVSTIFAKQEMTVSLETDHLKMPQRSDIKTENKTVTLLNQLFNSDLANKNTVLIINNDSDCDFTMMILGGKSYTVPVAARKMESIVVEQGEYVMRSEVCRSPYLAKKNLIENTQVNIKYSIADNTESKTDVP